ncbi:PD-(D/E)XK nuclease family protein [Nocardioides agariphilus]|uniref:PD-(D/E)XK nuclease family protein n=1 Tax=Nocardioides agariphilus TaxID=433664 RepID=A0A930VL91_9ACTN|nr:PD-(D/E)XK nuclease family protein [Nocardioides agariphilus]
MTDLLWHDPACDPLDRVSPSALNVLLGCPKRLAFQRAPETRHWRRHSPRTALGSVAHKLTELVSTGKAPAPPERKEWLEIRWTELVHKEHDDLRQEWPNRTVPDPKDWPGYVATRVRLIRRLADLPAPKDKTAGHSTTGEGSGERPFPWVERQLEDVPRRLFGTPDRVEERDGRLRVLDLKSGVHQAGISHEQRRQLLIYAHLVQHTCHRLPDDAVIQDVKGHEDSVTVVPEEMGAVVAEANDAIDVFNAMVEATTISAQPDPQVCMWCPFRAVCPEYWTNRTDQWPRLDVRGVVAERVGADGVRLDLTTPVGGTSTFRVLLTGGVEAAVGDELVVLDLEPAGPGAGRMRWDSRLRAGSEG